jgi:hypothetical protein
LEDDANASSNIIHSLKKFSKTQFNHDSIHGTISTMQFLNQVNNLINKYFDLSTKFERFLVLEKLNPTLSNYFSFDLVL